MINFVKFLWKSYCHGVERDIKTISLHISQNIKALVPEELDDFFKIFKSA